MDRTFSEDNLDPPDIRLDGLKIWVHSRQYPDVKDYWDGNWLIVTVQAAWNGAQVWVRGPILHIPELAQWAEESERLYKTLNGEAKLSCMEPNLSVKLTADMTGQIQAEVKITPDHLTQDHLFKIGLDQSYLPEFLQGCKRVLQEYPVVGLI